MDVSKTLYIKVKAFPLRGLGITSTLPVGFLAWLEHDQTDGIVLPIKDSTMLINVHKLN